MPNILKRRLNRRSFCSETLVRSPHGEIVCSKHAATVKNLMCVSKTRGHSVQHTCPEVCHGPHSLSTEDYVTTLSVLVLYIQYSTVVRFGAYTHCSCLAVLRKYMVFSPITVFNVMTYFRLYTVMTLFYFVWGFSNVVSTFFSA